MGKKRSKPTISCCMIVKNEEAFLGKCLESIKDYVDEIIIVDTGSTDTTVDIAGRFTDKVYFHPWEDSFSKARNQSISYAGKEWIFIIDADEELLPESGPLLRKAVSSAEGADALLVNIISTYYQGRKTARHNLERLFRNNKIIKFESIVHNRVVGAVKTLPSKIELMHYGYDHGEKKRNEKFLRTSALLRKQIEENPEDPLPHHYIGASYLSIGNFDECIKESLLAVELAGRKGDNNTAFLWSHYNAAYSMVMKDDFEQAGQTALQALACFPNHLDSHYILTLVSAEKGDWDKVVSYGRRFIELLDFYKVNIDKAGLVINCTLNEAPAVHTSLGHAYHNLGDKDSMRIHYEKACSISESKYSAWVNAADFHMDLSGDLELAREFLERAKAEAPEESSVWLAGAKFYQKLNLPDQERDCLIKVFQAGTDDIKILKRLALLCIESQDYALALEALNAAGRVNPSDYAVLVNKGRVHWKLNAFAEAIEAYSAALGSEQASMDIAPWIEMGKICLDIERWDEAEILFERALAIRPGKMELLLQLCEMQLLRGDIIGFVRRCDSVLIELGMERDRTINSIEDIARIILEIDLQLKDRAGLSEVIFRLLRLLPNIDYKQMLRDMKSRPWAEENAFALNRLESLIQLTP